MPILFDSDSGKVFLNDLELGRLNYNERLIFELFIAQKNQILSKDKLLETGWPNRVVVPNSLNIAIRNIRSTLVRGGVHNEPETIPKMGYKLGIDVAFVSKSDEVNELKSEISQRPECNVEVPSHLALKSTNILESKAKSFGRVSIRDFNFIIRIVKSFKSFFYFVFLFFSLCLPVVFYSVIESSEPVFFCKVQYNINFCGAHEIRKEDIPKSLRDDEVGEYWFMERNNAFQFYKVN